jgi:hypothetical protein
VEQRALTSTVIRVICAYASLMAPAFASFRLSVNGSVATFVGHIDKGDDVAFVQQLNTPHSPPLRSLYLESAGGNVRAGIAMARAIRRVGLITAVDARSEACGSACTMLFIAGVQRHYVHGEVVREGFGSMTGLGFHRAHQAGKGRLPDTLAERLTEMVCALYTEMGVPRACDLAMRASFGPQFHPGGATALSMGIATSLEAP